MNKHLLFSILSTCMIFSPLAGHSAHEDREEQDHNSSEYDLYEQNEDKQDFDPYNFSEEYRKPSERNFQQRPNNSANDIPNYTTQRDNYRNSYDRHNYDQSRDNNYKGNSNIKSDVKFFEEGGYDEDFDPYFPDQQNQYDIRIEQQNMPNDSPSRFKNNPPPANYQNNPNYKNQTDPNYQNNPSTNQDNNPETAYNEYYCPRCHKYH